MKRLGNQVEEENTAAIETTVIVSAIITNEQGEYLLIQHVKRGWEPPGGRIEQNEDLPTALIREVREETGFLIRVGELMGIYQNIGVVPSLLFVLNGHVIGGEMQTSEESLEVAWRSRQQAMASIMEPGTLERFRELTECSGQLKYHSFTSTQGSDGPPSYTIHREGFT